MFPCLEICVCLAPAFLTESEGSDLFGKMWETEGIILALHYADPNLKEAGKRDEMLIESKTIKHWAFNCRYNTLLSTLIKALA